MQCALGWPCLSREARPDDPLWSLPTSAILSFCDSPKTDPQLGTEEIPPWPGTSTVGKMWCSPEKRQMDKGVRYEKGQMELIWFRKEKTGRDMIMIYPPIKTCCRADNDELCSLSLMPCNLLCRRGDLDVISEMLSNLKRKGWKRLAINSTASLASLSQFFSQPCPHQQTVIVKIVLS